MIIKDAKVSSYFGKRHSASIQGDKNLICSLALSLAVSKHSPCRKKRSVLCCTTYSDCSGWLRNGINTFHGWTIQSSLAWGIETKILGLGGEFKRVEEHPWRKKIIALACICLAFLWLHWPNMQKHTKRLLSRKNKQISLKEPCISDVFSVLRLTSPKFCCEFIALKEACQNLSRSVVFYSVPDSVFWFSYYTIMSWFVQNLLKSSSKTFNRPRTRLRSVILGTIRNTS